MASSITITWSPIVDTRVAKDAYDTAEFARTHNWDWLTVVHGRERTGKTVLATYLLLASKPALLRAAIEGDYEEIMKHYAWDVNGYVRLMQVLPKGEPIVYNESRMLGRRAMSKLNVRLVEILSTMGNQNRFHVWTFPDYNALDPYARQRCLTVVYVATKKRQRGFAHYSAIQRTEHPVKSSGETFWIQHLYRARFYRPAWIDPLLDAITIADDTAKTELLNRGLDDTESPLSTTILNLRQRGLSIRDIAGITGMSRSRVGEIAKETPAVEMADSELESDSPDE